MGCGGRDRARTCDLVVVSELRAVKLPAGSLTDLGFRCPPVTVVVRPAQVACGPSAVRWGFRSRLLADAFGAAGERVPSASEVWKAPGREAKISGSAVLDFRSYRSKP